MKTAISLPDALYHRAERWAQRLGCSRSALYAEALEAYLDAAEDADEVTSALDELCADAAAGALEEPLGVLDAKTIRRVDDGLRLVLSLG